jgi:hypothetical protein
MRTLLIIASAVLGMHLPVAGGEPTLSATGSVTNIVGMVDTSITLLRKNAVILRAGIYAYKTDWANFPPATRQGATTTFADNRDSSEATIVQPVCFLPEGLQLKDVNTDPFAGGAPLHYRRVHMADGYGSYGWLLVSVGPDGRKQVDLDVYRPNDTSFCTELLLNSYDPTNGMVSRGDIWWSKESLDFRLYARAGTGFVEFVADFYGQHPVSHIFPGETSGTVNEWRTIGEKAQVNNEE